MTLTNLTVKDLGDIVEASFNIGTTHVDMQIRRETLMEYDAAEYIFGKGVEYIVDEYLNQLLFTSSYLKQNLK